MSLRSTSTVLVGSLVLVLVGAAGWLLLLGPTTTRVAEQREAAGAAADRSQALASQLAALQDAAEDLTATEAADEELGRLFPSTADQPGFFEQVGEVARAAGYQPADIINLSPTAPLLATPDAAGGQAASEPGSAAGAGTGRPDADAPLAEYAEQTVSMTLTGSYDQARRLLAGLERLDRAFLLRSMSLTGDPDSLTLTVALTASTFVAPPLTAPRDDPDPTSQPG